MFKAQRLTFDELSDRLRAYERQYGYSTIELDDYFAAVERGLRQNVQIASLEEPITCLASDDYNGLLRGRLVFWDGSYLDIYEVVSTELGYPVRVHYAHTYLRAGRRVFRYDNAPYYPEIVTHPHHKHGGPADRLAPADQPSLSQVLAKVAGQLRFT